MKYEGAVAFCEWVGGHLPTEDEWEYAALHDGIEERDVLYPWGNEPPEFCVHANFKESPSPAHFCGPNGKIYDLLNADVDQGSSSICWNNTLVRGQTPTGLTHMAGNLEELISPIYKTADETEQELGVHCPIYRLKGGSFASPAEDITIRSHRELMACSYMDSSRYLTVGFRCVVDN